MSTSWHTKMTLALNDWIWNVLHSNLHTTSKHALKLVEHGRCCIHNNQLLTKSCIELEHNLNIPFYWPNLYVPQNCEEHSVDVFLDCR